MAGNARALRAASLGQALPLVDVGMTRELMPAASSGQGHVRAGRGLPTPCRRGDRLHVSQPRIDSRGWRYRQRQVKQAGRAYTKRRSTLPNRGQAIGRWSGFESRQGGSGIAVRMYQDRFARNSAPAPLIC